MNKVNTPEREVRSTQEAVTLKDERIIEGYAIVFGQESRVIVDWYKDIAFVEVIDRAAITQELLDTSDVKALVNHNTNQMVARRRNGEGTLELELDSYGLKYRFTAPNTTHGNDLLEMVKRGDLFGSSFAFSADETKDEWDYSQDIAKRKIGLITRLYDVSPVADPAYLSTSVSARATEGYQNKVDKENKGSGWAIKLRRRRSL